MKILNYIIPIHLQNNNFLHSLTAQLDQKGSLSRKQIDALEDILEIRLDFFLWDAVCPSEIFEEYGNDFNELMEKMKRNRFKSNRSRNRCIRCIESIVDGAPNSNLIEDALGRSFRYGYRRFK